MTHFKTLTATLILASSAALTAIPASAATNTADKVSTRISVADIQTEKGLMKAYKRLRTEARKQCTVTITGSRLPRTDDECAADLLDDFIKDSGIQELVTLHQEKTAG
jgi:UrcA family protein